MIIKKITRERLYKREYDKDINVFTNDSHNTEYIDNLAKIIMLMVTKGGMI